MAVLAPEGIESQEVDRMNTGFFFEAVKTCQQKYQQILALEAFGVRDAPSGGRSLRAGCSLPLAADVVGRQHSMRDQVQRRVGNAFPVCPYLRRQLA